MPKSKEDELTLAAEVLLYFFAFGDVVFRPFGKATPFTGRANDTAYSAYRVLRNLERRGLLKVFKQNRKKLYALTEEGRLKALFIKAHLPKHGSWDGKWRMMIFDIPEDARQERNRLRVLLKSNGFKQVQKSVFINPHPLNREAIAYLQQTGLDRYIRVFRIDEADKENELRKMFSLD